MYDNTVSANNVLTSLEAVLSLESRGDARVEDILNEAVSRLENQYDITLDRDIYTIQSESQLIADNLDILLRDLGAALQQVTFLTCLKTYHCNMALSLADCNYLGYERGQLLTALKYLMYEKEYKRHHDEIIQPLTNALNNINICTVKRLFICLLMLDRLGISEGVAVIAQYLFLGGLVL